MKKTLTLLLGLLLLFVPLYGCAIEGFEDAITLKEEAVFETATAEDVAAALADPASRVLDARPEAAYAGWALDGQGPAGHPEGAGNFAADWLDWPYDDAENLEGETRDEVLAHYRANKDIAADTPVIVYDAGNGEAARVADHLAAAGVEDIRLFDVHDWDGEFQSYPRYELLMPAEKVHALLAGEPVESLEGDVVPVILHVLFGDPESSGYVDGHVPGALFVNINGFEEADNLFMLADDAVLLDYILELGVTATDTVIVTGPEPMASSRLATILYYMGVADVRVMSGGLTGWIREGFALEEGLNEPTPAADFGAEVPVRPDAIMTQEEVAVALINDPHFMLVDNRSIAEWLGETAGIPDYELTGRIPGAMFGYAGKASSNSMSYYRTLAQSMREAREIERLWDFCGVDPAKRLAFGCASGWRAAEIYWYARVMGYENVALYSDGWIGWSAEGRPMDTGQPAFVPVEDPAY